MTEFVQEGLLFVPVVTPVKPGSPDDGYLVELIDSTTGEVRWFKINWPGASWHKKDHPEGDLFWWTEGNFGCDCNRGMSFVRAQDGWNEEAAPEDWADDIGCGHTRYRATWAWTEDGSFVRIDPEPKTTLD